MKRYKYCFLVSFTVLFVFNACMQIPESSQSSSFPAASSQASSESNSIPDVSSQPSVPLGSSYSLEEYKAILQPYLAKDEFINYVEAYNVHPSPDGKNQFIEVVVYLGYSGQGVTNDVSYLFFNDFDHFVEDYLYEFMKTVKWIDNRRALIDQGTIIDIETGQKHYIMDNSYFDNDEMNYIVESDINASGTQIVTFNLNHYTGKNKLETMLYLYLYDIAEDKWRLLYEAPDPYDETADPAVFLKWKTDDCIEFYVHSKIKYNYIISTGEVIEISDSQ